MKIIIKHSSGLKYKSKELSVDLKQLKKDLKEDQFFLEGEEHDYIIMKDFLSNSVVVIIN